MFKPPLQMPGVACVPDRERTLGGRVANFVPESGNTASVLPFIEVEVIEER